LPITVVDLWTDGSGTSDCHPGGWAYVLTTADPITGIQHTKERSGRTYQATNNRMELTAAIEGLNAIIMPSCVVVHTDSQYVCKAFTEDYVTAWQERKWRKVKNVDLWRKLIHQVDRHHLVRWKWVPRDAGFPLNERCDLLAGQERRAAIAELAEGTEKLPGDAGVSASD